MVNQASPALLLGNSIQIKLQRIFLKACLHVQNTVKHFGTNCWISRVYSLKIWVVVTQMSKI